MPAAPGADSLALRTFLKTDLAAAYALDQVCFPEGIAYSRAELRYFVSRPLAFGIVVSKADSLVGFLIASHQARQPRGMAHIITLDVDPILRRKGVASMLMENAEQHYRKLGMAGIELEVAVDNEPAQQFYLQRGFTPTGLLRGYYDGRLDAVSMRKVFTS
jgi:ribosomal-protein-alanine N-acetyltransferase